MVRRVMLLTTLSLLLSSGRAEAPAAEPETSLVALADWSCLFAGRRTKLPFRATSEVALRGRLGWSLSVFGRTVARGEITLDASPRKSAHASIPLDIPPVGKGQIIPADLVVELYGSDRAVVALLEKRLWVCSDDPFAGQAKWLEGLQICLFDPVGKTREVFQKAGIPFSQTANVDSLVARKDALLVVGEGVSLEAYRGLPGLMIEAAARGVPILCLAPADGCVGLPRSGGAGLPDPDSVILRRASVIRDLDKQLDAHAWPPDGQVATRSLALASKKTHITANVVEQENGWLWLEAGFPHRRGRLIVCCFDIVAKWDAGPVPRFLLAGLLEYLDAESSRPPTPTISSSSSSYSLRPSSKE